MNIFAIISFLAFIICFFLGNFIYHKNPKNQLNIMILILCSLVGVLALVEFEYRQASTFETAYFWLQISGLWPIVPAVLLHISLIFTKSKILMNKFIYIILYLPALIISYLAINTNLLLSGIVQEYWGWTYAIPKDMTLYNIMALWTVSTVALAGLLCIAYYLKSKNLKRKQAKYVFAGLYMPLLISLVSDFILPSASIRVPEMTMTMMTVGIGIISYGIWKYRLPALTAAVAADKIVSTMSNFLLLLDTDKNIINVNQATRNLLGYEDLELIGKSAEIIFPDEEGKKALFDVDHGLINKGVIANKETHFKAKNGVIIPVFLSISLIQSEKGEILGIVCIGSDIIDITNAKNEIRASLEEKELLLREVHHRVKNNLQIISSLLNLQSNYIKDENDLELFKDSQSRVKSMAFIHEQLYQSSSFIDIEFSEYVNNLVTYLLHYYTVEPNIIKLKTNIENVSLDLNTSIPCGLIVNELVTNSLKHAFPVTERHRPANRRFTSPAKEIRRFEDKNREKQGSSGPKTKGFEGSSIPVTENHGPATGTFASPNIENREQESEIYIDLHSINDDQYILIIADNGIGIPEDIDFENTESLGLQLVNSLVMQLEGTIKLDRSAGTKFEIIFSKLEYKERL